MNTVITYYITSDGKEWHTDTDIEKATIKADDIKGQVFVYQYSPAFEAYDEQSKNIVGKSQQLILVYSHGERQLRLS